MKEPGFITVKYGDDKRLVLNPWCPCFTLLDTIKRSCEFSIDAIIDLIDLEGNLTNLSQHQNEYAYLHLGGRQTYILIRVEDNENDESKRYLSLLNDIQEAHPIVSEKINTLSQRRPSTKNLTRRDSKWNSAKIRLIRSGKSVKAFANATGTAANTPAKPTPRAKRSPSVASSQN